jgi:hypothetical protein
MNARNIVKIQFGFDAGAVRVARLQLASSVDTFVARWLERVATNAEAAQRLLTRKTEPEAQA